MASRFENLRNALVSGDNEAVNEEFRILNQENMDRIVTAIMENKDPNSGRLIVDELQEKTILQEGEDGLPGFFRGLYYLNLQNIVMIGPMSILTTPPSSTDKKI